MWLLIKLSAAILMCIFCIERFSADETFFGYADENGRYVGVIRSKELAESVLDENKNPPIQKAEAIQIASRGKK